MKAVASTRLLTLDTLPTSVLFDLYGRTIEELRRRHLLRSMNNPVADYAEYLVAKALHLKLCPKSTQGLDAEDRRGQRYQIKARRVTPQNKSRQLSVIRDLDRRHFDFLVAVVFRVDFSLHAAWMVPYSVVRKQSTYRKHVNGWILHARDSLAHIGSVRDVTSRLAAVARE